MERTLLLLKPCTVQRRLIGEVINRIERKGLRIVGMKMMQLDDKILNEHYAHLTERPFFPWLIASMKSAPVVAMCVEGNSAVTVVRNIVGATNGRKAAPGTIRGDYSMSGRTSSTLLTHLRQQPSRWSDSSARRKSSNIPTLCTTICTHQTATNI